MLELSHCEASWGPAEAEALINAGQCTAVVGTRWLCAALCDGPEAVDVIKEALAVLGSAQVENAASPKAVLDSQLDCLQGKHLEWMDDVAWRHVSKSEVRAALRLLPDLPRKRQLACNCTTLGQGYSLMYFYVPPAARNGRQELVST